MGVGRDAFVSVKVVPFLGLKEAKSAQINVLTIIGNKAHFLDWAVTLCLDCGFGLAFIP
jgi:hypothetical protein